MRRACASSVLLAPCWLAQEESAVSKWCAFDLFVSQDFGRHWNNLTIASGGRVASFWDFDWGANVMQRTELGFRDETGPCGVQRIVISPHARAEHLKACVADVLECRNAGVLCSHVSWLTHSDGY